jgi:hypothetical protein
MRSLGFAPFRLDLGAEQLWRGEEARPLTRERMLRELAEAVEVLTAERPLVLVLEDLHWSDMSTLEWLAYVARRRGAAVSRPCGPRRALQSRCRPWEPVAAALHLAHPAGRCGALMRLCL